MQYSVTDHNSLVVIIDRLDRAAVVREIVAGFRAEIPGYRRLPTTVLDQQIVDITRRNLDLCFDSISTDDALSRTDLEPFMASARDRATEGMPLEDLLHAYRLGGRIGWRSMVEAARPDEGQALLVAAELVMRYIDEASAAVAQAYLEERQQVVSEEERSARDLFEAVTRDVQLGSRLQELAKRRGFDLVEHYHPFVMRVPGSGGRPHADLARRLRREGVLALTEGDRVAGLLAPGGQQRLSSLAGLTVIGDVVARTEAAQAIEEIRLIAELAEAAGISGIVEPQDFLLELLLLAAPRHAQAIVKRALTPLQALDGSRGAELLVTLELFIAQNLDRRAAAKALHVHPNTLDYRLRRVRELTGLDPHQPDDLALLVLALKQRTLSRS